MKKDIDVRNLEKRDVPAIVSMEERHKDSPRVRGPHFKGPV